MIQKSSGDRSEKVGKKERCALLPSPLPHDPAISHKSFLFSEEWKDANDEERRISDVSIWGCHTFVYVHGL